jgi:branched-chain amino acid transport system substrate-binding protein
MALAFAGGVLGLAAAALSGCGGSSDTGAAGATNASAEAGGRVVDIYSSLPMHGPSAGEALATVNGIELALTQARGRAGSFTVRYTPLDDSAGAAGWDASRTAANARKAAGDPRSVLYIGEFDDGASEVSMPILNEAGIPQVSPANTYAGLTTGAGSSGAGSSGAGSSGAGSSGAGSSGAMTRFAPTGTRTYLRIVPIDSVQAAAILVAMKQGGCTKVAVADDQEPYGVELAKLVDLESRFYGVDVASTTGVDPTASGLRASLAAIRRGRPDCLLLAGSASKVAVQITRDVHGALPAARIFALGAMCTSAWTNPNDGGVPAGIDSLIECTAATRSVTSYPGGRTFLAAYRTTYRGEGASPYAILGYEAMKLGLSTIAGLGADGDSKSAVLSALFSTADRRSVLGTYSFDRNGDTTLRACGLYRVGRSGDPVFVRTITPPHVL